MRKLLAIAFFCVALCFSACGSDDKQTNQEYEAPVKVAKVEVKDVPLYVKSIGSVTPQKEVVVASRVAGEIVKQYVKEGQMVSKGDLLFEIDSRPFEENLRKAEAMVEKAEAKVSYLQRLHERYQDLVEGDYISKDLFAQNESTLSEALSILKEAKASAEQAELELGYCFITAPSSGLTSIVADERKPGNLLTAYGQSLMSVIPLDTLDVLFTLPQDKLPLVHKYWGKKGDKKLEILIEDSKSKKASGILKAIDNTIDYLTGTLTLKGELENKKGTFWPGQYVMVTLNLTTLKNALLVPETAVQFMEKGSFVYVVGKDKKAEVRMVTLGQNFGDDVVIEKGVKEGEEVVTAGQLKVFPGATLSF